MAFCGLVWKSIRFNRLKNNYLKEKLNSIRISEGEDINLSAGQKYRHFWIDLREKFKQIYRCSRFPRLEKFSYQLRHYGSLENYLMKSAIGFLSGCLLTYVLFIIFVVQLNVKLSKATVICCILGCILTIGLAYSQKVRCIVLLTLPQFFSKRGRKAIIAWAFILAIAGPIKNTSNNLEILYESLACEQEQLKAILKAIWTIVKRPLVALKDAFKIVVKKIKEVLKKIKEVLLKIKRIILAILDIVKTAFKFLYRLLNVCNREVGTPFERCSKVFENAVADCNAKLGPYFRWLCSLNHLIRSVCYIVKPFDYICMVLDFIDNSIIGKVMQKLKQFLRHMRAMFYVRIQFSHSYQFYSNTSRSYTEIKSAMVAEIKERTKTLLIIFSLFECVASLFVFFIVIKVIIYKYKYLTSSKFDNKYITRNFIEIDMRRAQLGKETILPLNHRERRTYITTTSKRIADWERSKILKSLGKLLKTALKLSFYMAVDYTVYWLIMKIRNFEKKLSKIDVVDNVDVQVRGKSFVADIVRSIARAFRIDVPTELDVGVCIPDPIPPNYDCYIQIGSLILLVVILIIFEPYGLRLRQWTMSYYYPARAKIRAAWLYNHILRSRTTFLKLARRKLRRKMLSNRDDVTFRKYIEYKFKNCFLCRRFFNFAHEEACLLCGQMYKSDDVTKLKKCSTPECLGIYCGDCYRDLQNNCTVCKSPIEYGDDSDVDQEKDSSEEELDNIYIDRDESDRLPLLQNR